MTSAVLLSSAFVLYLACIRASGVTSLVAAADVHTTTGMHSGVAAPSIVSASGVTNPPAKGAEAHAAAPTTSRLTAGTAESASAAVAAAAAGLKSATTAPSSTISDLTDLAAERGDPMAAHTVLQADIAGLQDCSETI